MRRREFLKLSATSAVGAVLFQACSLDKLGEIGDGSPEREFKIQSPVNVPEDALFGNDAWYASVNPESPGGPGITIRVFEGRAKKVEGNPNHPVNGEALGALSQSMVQDLYHPDRIATPLRRTGNRGSGEFTEISWDEALDELVARLQELQGAGRGSEVVAITEPMSGTQKQIANRFIGTLGGERLSFDTLDQTVLRQAMQLVFGSNQLPVFDFPNARFVLSFGADFLQTWISPVQYSRGYGLFRQGREDIRGTLYHAESRMSGTAANADRWLPVTPGTEGVLALAIASVIMEEGLASSGGADAFSSVVGDVQMPTPEDAAGTTGVSAEMIRDAARRFAGETPSIALGGGSAAAHTNGLFNLSAIYALNLLVGSVNAEGGIRVGQGLPEELSEFAPDTPLPYQAWQDLSGRLETGSPSPVSLLMVHGANPVYGLPAAAGFAESLTNVETIISFSSYIDETTAHADLVLPDNVPLESWGAHVPSPGTGYPVISFQQPVVLPFYETRAFSDILLSVAEELGGPVLEQLPWDTTEAAVRELADQLRQREGGNIQATGTMAEFWVELLQTGVWMDPAAASTGQATEPGGSLPAMAQAEFAGSEEEYPYYFLPYPSATLGAGEYSRLPWLQGLPDPITTVVWDSWVEVNPQLADEIGVTTGRFVTVTTPQGSAELQVYVNPAAPPYLMAIPMGQGHQFYGRYAENRGINPLDLLAPLTDSETGTLAWGATRVQIEPADRKEELVRFEGVQPEGPEDYQVVRVTRPEH